MDSKQCILKQRPSPPTPLPQGEERNVICNIHYRGGLNFSGLLGTSRDLRKNETKAEKALWKHLRAKKLNGLKFRRQHQIGLYIVDFYCHRLKLIIELDGKYHTTVDQMEKDKIRDENLLAEGFRILRYQNHIALYKPDVILDAIKNISPLSHWEEAGSLPEQCSAAK